MKYKALWVLFLAHFLLFFFQELAFTVATVAGKDFGNLVRLNYAPGMKYFLWISSELSIIAADIQEVIGAAIAINILTGLNMVVGSLLYFLKSIL